MPKGRKKGDHDAKRVEIATAACRVLLRRGLEQTSLADIAREIGATTGILRHYFANKKDEILLYAKNLIFDKSIESAADLAACCTGLDRLRAMAINLLPVGPETIDYRLLAMFNGSAIGNASLMRLQDKRRQYVAFTSGNGSRSFFGRVGPPSIIVMSLDEATWRS